MQVYLNYFNFVCLTYFNIKVKINLKIGFLSFLKKLSFYFFKQRNKLFFFTKGIKSLIIYIIRLFNLLKFGHFIELLTVGLGYKVNLYRLQKQLCFELNYSHKIFYNKPIFLLFKVFKKRFLIFGINQMEVLHVAKLLRSLRSPNIYKGTGIRFKTEKVNLKIGKTR